MPLVRVTWVDSHACSHWQTEDEWVKDIARFDDDVDDLACLTVGWLFRETERALYVFPSQSAGGQMMGMVQIPLVAVLDRRVLSEEVER